MFRVICIDNKSCESELYNGGYYKVTSITIRNREVYLTVKNNNDDYTSYMAARFETLG